MAKRDEPHDVGINSPMPPIESKEVRDLCRQCQRCWKRRADVAKLFVCASCKTTSYCSTKCQKEDWPVHKEPCKTKRNMRKAMAEADELTAMMRKLTGEDEDLPLMSTIDKEMGEFLKRFRPMICRAGYCCLNINQNPDAWKKYVFQLRIERIKNPPKESKLWERYRVVSGERVSIEWLLKEKDGFRQLLPQFQKYHEENVRVGCVGTVTTFLVCDSSGTDVRGVSWGGYGLNAWDDAPGENWLETLQGEVERMSGKTTRSEMQVVKAATKS